MLEIIVANESYLYMSRTLPHVEQLGTNYCPSRSVYRVLIGLVISCILLDKNTKRDHMVGCAPKSF
jgi:hypothetical protein